MSIRPSIGWWRPAAVLPDSQADAALAALGDLGQSLAIYQDSSSVGVATGGECSIGSDLPEPEGAYPLLAYAPAMPPEQLGSPEFLADHGVRYAMMTGAMANGIASCEVVEAMANAGMLGSFGAAGLSIERVTAAVDRLQTQLGSKPFAVNLIHSPNEPAHEMAIANLLLHRGVRLIEASAYLDLTPAVVKYRVSGLIQKPDGTVECRNKIIAKVSRSEVARRFLGPGPARLLNELLSTQQVTPAQAELAARVPMCDDLTAEADSGGHTDNRPAITLLPTLLALRNSLQTQFGFAKRVRVGLAGGIATPASVAGAFALGADYVVTGSINQACIESGSSDRVRQMLSTADQADVIMAPAADMFEMGVKVQVLKRGTMFAMRGQKLYEVYRANTSWANVPAAERTQIEKTILQRPFEDVWAETREFFLRRDPGQVTKAEADPRHQMALVFRWYLGLSSRWANAGDENRQLDYQVWCGPAMGAFNEWAKGSFLEAPANRRVALVARNLLYGAGVLLRATTLRQQGASLPEAWVPAGPWTDDQLQALGV
jgi:trans-AT polyketide synthase, acyltransferase and oxidoreductase domains